MSLTQEQKNLFDKWTPLAFKVANNWISACGLQQEREVWHNTALIALCQAVQTYTEGTLPIQKFIAYWVRNRLVDEARTGRELGTKRRQESSIAWISSDDETLETGLPLLEANEASPLLEFILEVSSQVCTKQEQELLGLLLDGHTHLEAAERLSISETRVYDLQRVLFSKLRRAVRRSNHGF